MREEKREVVSKEDRSHRSLRVQTAEGWKRRHSKQKQRNSNLGS